MKFIEKPSVQVVAHSVMNDEAVLAWAQEHGFGDAAEDQASPLFHIIRDVGERGVESIDALPEFGGRFCYRSFEKGRTREDYIANVIEMEHGSVFHHATVSFAISGISRSLSHELVRHHAGCDPSQESQRYVDAKDINFVVPPLILATQSVSREMRDRFEDDCENALHSYRIHVQRLTHAAERDGVKFATMAKKRALEAARAILPNAAETRMLWTMNMRAARYLISLRGGEGADLEIRRLAVEFAQALKAFAPVTFKDAEIYTAEDGFGAVRVAHPKI